MQYLASTPENARCSGVHAVTICREAFSDLLRQQAIDKLLF
jgi:hypothetical protein